MELKTMLIIVILNILMILKFIDDYLRARTAKFEAQTTLLLCRWNLAKEIRLLWEDKHIGCLEFDDPLYQTLWNNEISAEAMYLIHTDGIGFALSWHEYCVRRQQATSI